jgi:transcriptional regulator with XRE-family HTH domain
MSNFQSIRHNNYKRNYFASTNVVEKANTFVLMESIGQRIARLRKAKGWSQARLGKESGVSQATIAAAERDPNRKPREILQISSALGVDPYELETGRAGEDRSQNLQPLSAVRVEVLRQAAEQNEFFHRMSPEAQRFVERLVELEGTAEVSPATYAALTTLMESSAKPKTTKTNETVIPPVIKKTMAGKFPSEEELARLTSTKIKVDKTDT